MSTALILTMDSVIITLLANRAGSLVQPRSAINGPTVDRSGAGAIIRTGTSYPSPHLWELNWIVDAATAQRCELHRDLYSQQAAFTVQIDDYISRFWEASPRSRAFAAGESATVSEGSKIGYYAQWQAEYQDAPKIEPLGNNWYRFTARLLETEVVPP
jgi:hypothetical protein